MTRREDTEGERGDEKLPGHILRVLRAALDVKQEQVARGLGRSGGTLSELENGSISRRDLQKAVRMMGLPPEAIEWTRDFQSRLDRARLCVAPGDVDDEERQEHRRVVAEFGQWVEEMAVQGLDEMDRLMRAAEEKRKAQILVERLRWLPQASRLALVQESAEYHFWKFALQVCNESLKATADNADHAREWAAVAVLAARHVPGEEGTRAGGQGYATVHLANALRVKGELKAADQAYGEGCSLLARVKGNLEGLNQARVLGFGASLRRAQRRFGEALELLEGAINADDGRERPYLLLNKARLLRDTGDLEGALEALQRAEPFLAEVENPRFLFVAQVNFVDHLSILGYYEDARRRLPNVWRLTDDAAGELDRVRLVWVQGRVAAGLGEEEEGIAALEQVRRTFGARHMAYDGALASLELATLRLRRGETSEVKSLAREMTPVFKNQEIHREALAALNLFCRAAEQDAASVALVEQLVRYLHRARNNPDLRFTPEQPTKGS